MVTTCGSVWVSLTIQSSFCFKCISHWYEDHRPATCQQVAAWGEAVFQETGQSGADNEMLDCMYIFQNTVKCPACGMRVQKSAGCQHLTCGASGDHHSSLACSACTAIVSLV
jgi:hypothetical protein